MIKLIFIRHPEVSWKGQRRYLGRTDLALNRKGEEQAKIISNYLKKEEVSAVYSSNLRRAYQTASIIAKYHSLSVRKDDSFNEIDFGNWEGMTFSQIQKKYPELAQKYLSNPLNTKIPEGESLFKFRNRVNKGLEKILAQEKGTVVIVSHAGVNRIIICSLFKLPLSCFWQIKQNIGAINIIEIYKSLPRFARQNLEGFAYSKNTNIISLINHVLWEN